MSELKLVKWVGMPVLGQAKETRLVMGEHWGGLLYYTKLFPFTNR